MLVEPAGANCRLRRPEQPVIHRPDGENGGKVCVAGECEFHLEDLAEVGVAASGVVAVAGHDGVCFCLVYFVTESN